MATRLTITPSQMMDWKDQAKAEQLAWHNANHAISESQGRAYSAGFDQGWQAALSTLALHGGVTLDSRNAKQKAESLYQQARESMNKWPLKITKT